MRGSTSGFASPASFERETVAMAVWMPVPETKAAEADSPGRPALYRKMNPSGHDLNVLMAHQELSSRPVS